MIFTNDSQTVIIQIDSWTMHSTLEDDILAWAMLNEDQFQEIAELDLHEGGSCSVTGNEWKSVTLSGDNGILILNEIVVSAKFA